MHLYYARMEIRYWLTFVKSRVSEKAEKENATCAVNIYWKRLWFISRLIWLAKISGNKKKGRFCRVEPIIKDTFFLFLDQSNNVLHLIHMDQS